MKYFCVGYYKTGTSSYSRAMRMLGLVDLHFPRRYAKSLIDAGRPVTWDACPWDSMSNLHESIDEIVELQSLYPDARFVLTTRNVDAWLRSIDAHMATPWGPELQSLFDARFQKLFGIDCAVGQYDARALRDAFAQHDAQVRDYFGDDLCVLDLDSGADLMQKLSAFVGRTAQYPRVNKTAADSAAGEAVTVNIRQQYSEAV